MDRFKTYGKESSRRPLEGQAPGQRHVQLYLVKETVLHRLGKARTEWQEAMNEQQFEQLLDFIVPGPKLLFQDTARSYCRIFWRSYNESILAAGYHCQEEEWRRKVLRLHVQWNCCRRVLWLLSHIRQRFRISWRFPQAKNSRPPHQSASRPPLWQKHRYQQLLCLKAGLL